MTCREKLAIEHPERLAPEYVSGCWGCPSDFGYLPDPEYCNRRIDIKCCDCWDRDILKEPGFEEPTIKDSGDRTQFESGAVRDMREGKGRCDLMPLEVVSTILNYSDGDTILDQIRAFQTSRGSRHLYEALDVFSIKAYSSNIHTMLLEVAKHFEEGAKKYGDNNWQKGIPVYCYIDSAVRHYLKWRRGDKDEPHDRAFVWNLMCCIWEVDYHKPTVEEASK